MRIWTCIEPRDLCRQHLLAQWREGLGLWNILQRIQAGELGRGYVHHPETKRWIGRERAFWNHLARTRRAMLDRGWSPRAMPLATDAALLQPNDPHADNVPPPWDDEAAVLAAKPCSCTPNGGGA